jgi:hypothetical protein
VANTLELSNFTNIGFVLNPPAFIGYQATTQSLNNTNWTSLSLDAESYDNYTGHSNITNNSRYTSQVSGWYTVSGVYAAVGNATGFRAVRIVKNGNQLLGFASYSGATTSSGTSIITPTNDLLLAAGDYVEVQGWQSTGGNLNTDIGVDTRSGLFVRFSHF